MNKKLKNQFEIIVKNFILLQPIIDLITSLSINCLHLNLTLGIIIRTLFLILVMFATVFVYKKKEICWYYLLIFLYFVLFVASIFIYKNGFNLIAEIQGMIKTFYFPIVLVSLYAVRKEVNINKKWLFTTLIIYVMIIFFSTLLNIGFDSYQIAKTGSIGLFNSANEISGIISILTPVLFIYFAKKENFLKKATIFIIYIIVILSIGTKTPLLSLVITTVCYVIWQILKYHKQKQHKRIATLILFFLVISTFVLTLFPKTSLYKNIKIHLEFLEVENIKDVLESPTLIDHFVFSQRLTFLDNKNKIYNNASSYEKLIGIGYYRNEKEVKMVEMDYFDIYYNHGPIGFILFFAPYIYILIDVIKNKKTEEKNLSTYMNNVSIFLIIILSLFTGHIITAPAVALIAVCIVLTSNKKNILIASYNLGMGGIEKSLLTLLKKINYNKYKVTLVLEKKEGIYLNEIPDDVIPIEYKASENKNFIVRKTINLIKRIKWLLFHYNQYDSSICYATYSLPCGFLARTASKNKIIFIHSNYKYVYKEDEKKIREFFDNRKITSYDKIIFVSNESKNDLLQYYPKIISKSHVINNLVDYNSIIELSKEKIEIKKTKKIFLFVGRLDESSKKISRIIESANYLKENKKVEFWIIGDGPNEEDYKQLIKKYNLQNIKMLGAKSNPYPYIKLCDYLILTSDYEGFPVVYNEAIILNKPILTTIDVSDDYIKIHNRFGLVMKKDVNDIVKKIEQVTEKDFVLNEKVDFSLINKKRINELEKLFDEVL